jgi:hypothetical protein
MNHPVALTLAVALFASVAIAFVVFLAFASPILLIPVAISAAFPSIEAARPLFGGGGRGFRGGGQSFGGPSAFPH